VRALAAHPALAGRVRVRGALGPGALEREYRRASVFALPSTRESYGMAVAEAMAHGLPVIACDIPASRELAAGAALLVPPRRVAPLAAALDVLTHDEHRRRDLGRLARARSRTLPTWAQTERALVRVVRAEL
jgi:glycosyltransferase involved in cell wall biosynthesis